MDKQSNTIKQIYTIVTQLERQIHDHNNSYQFQQQRLQRAVRRE